MPGVVLEPSCRAGPEKAAAELLDAPSPEDRFKAARDLKNLAIGSRTRKAQLIKLGVAEKLVKLLAEEDASIVVQAAGAIGSLAHGNDEGVRSLFAAGASKALLLLTRGNGSTLPSAAELRLKVVEAAARALRTLFNAPSAPPAEAEVLHGMLPLLSSGSDLISEAAASVVARCCGAAEHREWILEHGGVPLFLHLLSAASPRSQEAALECLGTLSRGSPAVGRLLAQHAGPILRLVRDRRPRIRLLAATCVVHMSGSAQERAVLEMRLTQVLPALVKLFGAEHDAETRAAAARLLAALVADSDELQKAAADADAIAKLGAFVAAPGSPAALREGALTALAALCGALEESRKACIEARVLPALVAALEDREGPVRAAACRLARSLSRSVKNLRTSLVDAGIALPLFKVPAPALSFAPGRGGASAQNQAGAGSSAAPPEYVTCNIDPWAAATLAARPRASKPLPRLARPAARHRARGYTSHTLFHLRSAVEVQVSAAATVCNIVLDFSPMKKVVLEQGGVARLVALASAPDATLRLNAVWALKNLSYMAESEVKGAIMAELTYGRLFRLLEDPSPPVQEQALTLLRNLAYGKRGDIEAVFEGAGPQLMPAIERCLASDRPETITQALYVVTNVACGDEAHKEAIMQSPALLRAVLEHMGHARSAIRVAAIWCVINLTWRDDAGTAARGAKLRALGFGERLRGMAGDVDLDVRDRVRTALSQLDAS
eukprot:tig00000900_g5391.t1